MKAFFIIFLCSFSFYLFAQQNEANRYIQIGKDSATNKNYVAALSNYKRALKIQPFNATILDLIGESFIKITQYDSAIAVFMQAIKLDSNNLLYRKKTGMLFYHLKRYETAIPYLETVVKYSKSDDSFTCTIAICLYEMKQYQKVIPLLNAYLMLHDDNVIALKYIGLSYMATNSYSEAISSFEKALFFTPNNPQILNYLAISQRNVGQTTAALSNFELAHNYAPNDVDIGLMLAESRFQIAQYGKARELYFQFIAQCPNQDELNFYIANSFFNEQNMDSSIVYYKYALAINANYDKCYEPIAAAYLRTKKFDGAVEFYSKVQSIHNSASINNFLGLSFLGLKNYLKAKDYFSQAILIDNKMGIAYFNLGRVEDLLNDKEGALISFKNAKNLMPGDVDALNYLAKAYAKVGDASNAIDNYLKALEIEPNTANLYKVAELYCSEKNYDAAFDIFQKLSALDQSNAHLYYKQGWCLDAKKSFLEAITMYQIALQYQENNKDFLLAIGNDYFQLEEYKNAIIYLNLALNQDPNFAKAYYLLGYTKYNLGKVKEAKELFLKANTLDSSYSLPGFLKQ